MSIATYLSGRYVAFEVFPFSFDEYADFLNLPKNKETFINYLKTGGLPELFKLNDHEAKGYYVNALKDTILLKDIVQRHNIKDAALLEKTFLFLADNIGNLFSINHIVNFLKNQKIYTNYPTITNYINHLLETFIFHEVKRYSIKGKTIFSSSSKYYLNDLSFRNYLFSGFDPSQSHHLENLIFLHYKRLGYQLYVGELDKYEVDFIAEKQGEKKYIQVAYILSSPEVAEREFRSLKKINDNYEKLIVSLDDLSFGNIEGIKHLRPWEL